MLSSELRVSSFVVNSWFGGLTNFLQTAGTTDLIKLRRLARLTIDLEQAIVATSPWSALVMREGASPEQLYPEGSLSLEIYRELLVGIGV